MKQLRVLEQEDISPPCAVASQCEACGAEFTCGASLQGCWCSEVKLTDAQRATLRERFQKCLCPTCLESFTDRSLR